MKTFRIDLNDPDFRMNDRYVRSISIVLGVFLFVFGKLSAQSLTEPTYQQWFQYYSDIKVADRWALLVDASYRLRDTPTKHTSVLLRCAVAYELQPKWRVAFGLADIADMNEGNYARNELRPHQELTFRAPHAKHSVVARFRAEERFIETIGGQAMNLSSVRLRGRVGVSFRLCTLSSTDRTKRIEIEVIEELFLNVFARTSTSVFQQNRIIFGPSLYLNTWNMISLQYNAQLASIGSGNERWDHVFWLSVRQVFPARSKPVREQIPPSPDHLR